MLHGGNGGGWVDVGEKNKGKEKTKTKKGNFT